MIILASGKNVPIRSVLRKYPAKPPNRDSVIPGHVQRIQLPHIIPGARLHFFRLGGIVILAAINQEKQKTQ